MTDCVSLCLFSARRFGSSFWEPTASHRNAKSNFIHHR